MCICVKRAESVTKASRLNDTTVIRMWDAEGMVREKKSENGIKRGNLRGETARGDNYEATTR